jgi:hypothetical protein
MATVEAGKGRKFEVKSRQFNVVDPDKKKEETADEIEPLGDGEFAILDAGMNKLGVATGKDSIEAATRFFTRKDAPEQMGPVIVISEKEASKHLFNIKISVTRGK